MGATIRFLDCSECGLLVASHIHFTSLNLKLSQINHNLCYSLFKKKIGLTCYREQRKAHVVRDRICGSWYVMHDGTSDRKIGMVKA